MRKYFNTALAVVAVTIAISGIATGQDATPPSVKAATDGIGKAGTDPVIDEEARQMAMELRKHLSGSNEELSNVAHEIGEPLIARLKYDLNIARVDQRRRRMEKARVSVVQMAEDAAEERRDLLSQMYSELEEIKRQFADDAQICESEQVAVVQAFRVRLQALKEREIECHDKANETSAELIALRRDKVTRERARWLAQTTPQLMSASQSPVPQLTWVREASNRVESPAATPIRTRPTQSLKEALASLEEFGDVN